jgi:hypothetical protein
MSKYHQSPQLWRLIEQLKVQAQLKAEYGAKGIRQPLAKAERALKDAVRELQALPIDETLAKREPNDLAQIKGLRPAGPRRIWETFDRAAYGDRLEGALLGRMAGCTLGAPVEFWSIVRMRALAEENGDAFPPTDYWLGGSGVTSRQSIPSKNPLRNGRISRFLLRVRVPSISGCCNAE